MPRRHTVKIVNGVIEVDTLEDGEEVLIVRGVVAPDSLDLLKIDKYQREVLPQARIDRIKSGVRLRRTPDIVLGMRGENHSAHEGGVFYLQDPVFIIDGQQRREAALQLLNGGFEPHLGMKLFFNTNYAFEKDLFDRLNMDQTKLSSNVILRNEEDTNPAMGALIRLCNELSFALRGKVCWKQKMRREELVTAMTFVKVVAMLHSHAGPGRSTGAQELSRGLSKIAANVGTENLVENTRVFFDVIDRSWGISRVFYQGGATYLKATFMIELARLFSDHTNFWKEDRLVVDANVVKKLQGFAINDPTIKGLASSSGASGEMLNHLLLKHINSGRRNRLTLRPGASGYTEESVPTDDEPEEDQ